ncbi:acyl-CoA dehydrogenase [Xanthobacter autotrophicus]|uniref:acyl-CoA dehydrogenase n=1 Tax=Xanthobacter autotrophicus TaxID=280 RepID=UPI0037272BEE
MTATSLIRRADLDFLLLDWLGADRLAEVPRFSDLSRETLTALLDLSETVAARHFLPHYKTADVTEPTLDASGVHILPQITAALSAYAEAGLFGQSFACEHGGMQLPLTVAAASFAHFLAANIATAAYPMLTVANARLITTFGSAALIDALARPEIEGRFFGTMCLSEPQAGSSLADIATRAVADGEDGLGPRYRLAGNKMWISGGDQDASENICHLVLAKIPGPDGKVVPGAAGISLFAVPKILVAPGDFAGAPNDVVVAGLNHKMGYRGTANCLLDFGEGQRHRPGGVSGAVGYLVGAPGQGLAIMFMMMNEARLQVGLGAAMLAYRSHRLSVAYAGDRAQGRPRGATPHMRPIPIIAHADVKRMLLAQKAYAEGSLALVLYCFHLADRAEAAGDVEARQLLDLLTPVAKTWSSEWGLAASDIAIQIHGGYGYTRDFDVEQLYRDNRLNPIHEGTTGIQSIDFVGRKLIRDKGEAFALLLSRIDGTLTRATGSAALAEAGQVLKMARGAVADVAQTLVADPAGTGALDNATAVLSAFGHLVAGWLWLDQALAAEAAREHLPAVFVDGKVATARYFAAYELPKIPGWLSPLRAAPHLLSEIRPELF